MHSVIRPLVCFIAIHRCLQRYSLRSLGDIDRFA
ncbi:hypothetical protein H5410_047870 [Solanum commersonii]|uniref:Uncharacterized protein n=1 Tax=Solanum commersonii TaxID=4109 RepID=A0A9J5XJI3_SOLCO|nr:hypothetical protein H5410_047870 [Solanum commersonii]